MEDTNKAEGLAAKEDRKTGMKIIYLGFQWSLATRHHYVGAA